MLLLQVCELHLRYDLHVEAGRARLLGKRSSRRKQVFPSVRPHQMLLFQTEAGKAMRSSCSCPGAEPSVCSSLLLLSAHSGAHAAGPAQALHLLHGGQFNSVQCDGRWGRVRSLWVLWLFMFLSRNIPLSFPVCATRAALLGALLHAGPPSSAPRGPACARLAAVGRSGGEAFIRVIQVEGLFTSTHAISV